MSTYDINKIQLPNGDICNLKDQGVKLTKNIQTTNLIHIEDAAAKFLKDCKIFINPVQNLHGYDKPWVGGAGKNLMPAIRNNEVKNNVTFSWNEDGTLSTSGTASASIRYDIFGGNSFTLQPGTYKIWGIDDSTVSFGGASIQLRKVINSSADENVLVRVGGNDSPKTFTVTDAINVYPVAFISAITLTKAADFTWYPMLIEATENDEYAPYSNICPITGWTEAKVYRSGEDTSNPTIYEIAFPSKAGTVYGGTLDVTIGELVVDRACINSYNGESITGVWISDRDVYAQGTNPTIGAQVVYFLSTPLVYHLTPQEIITLSGDNTMWADTGNISCIYYINSDLNIESNNYVRKPVNTMTGDIIYYSNNNISSRLEIGNQGYVLKVNSNGLPQWKNENVAEYKTLTNQEVATFDDGVQNSVLKNYNIKIEPKQDLHGYNHSWVGGCGKNLFAYPWNPTVFARGMTFTDNGDGSLTVSGTNDGTGTSEYYWTRREGLEGGKLLLKAGNYIINGFTNMSNASIAVAKTTNGAAQIIASIKSESGTFTLNNDTYIQVGILVNKNASVNYTIKPMIRLSTITDSTYEPYSNICPIEGWDEIEVTRTGKNLWNTQSVISNYAINASGTVTQLSGWDYTATAVKVIPGKTYSFSFTSLSSNSWTRRLHGYDRYGNWKQQLGYVNQADVGAQAQISFTVPEDVVGVKASLYSTEYKSAQLEIASTATTYEPYIEQTLSISMESVTGSSIYGGTLTVNQDGTGTLIVDRRILTITGNDIEQFGSGSNVANRVHTKSTFIDEYKIDYCNSYKIIIDSAPIDAGGGIRLHPTNDFIYIYNDSFIDLNDAITKLNTTPVVCILKLTTSFTYTLTVEQLKILFGINTIWSDAGKITITYPTNIKGYIDSVNNNINTLFGNNQEDTTANKAYAIGDLFMYNGKLYKATSAISLGGVISPGTNCIQTTLLEGLINADQEAY